MLQIAHFKHKAEQGRALIQKERAGLSLTPAERDVLNRVPEFGRNIPRKLPQLETVAQDLYVGQELMAPIETSEGTVLVGTGSKITQVLLNKMSNFAEMLSIREPIYVQAAGQSR